MDISKSDIKLYCKSKSNLVIKAAGQYMSKDKARRFASSVPGTQTDQREKKCIRKAMAFLRIPPGISVLDIPCGAGRMFPLLKEHGYRVTGADISASMIEEAGQADYNELKVADIFETGFNDKEFDLVISHRLFQYFTEGADRRSALTELQRISKGPIIVSFSCNLALDVLVYRIKRFLGITRLRSCEPVSFTDFAKDAQSVGLEVVRWIATRPLISKRWYAVLRPRTATNATLSQRLATFNDISRSLLLRSGICAAVVMLLIFFSGWIKLTSQKTVLQFQQTVRSYVHNDSSELIKVASGIGMPVSTEKLNIRGIIKKDKSLNKDSLFLLPQLYTESIKSAQNNDLQFIKYLELTNDRFAFYTTETDLIVTD
jgi:SAM-dependent methyltransferase